MPRKLPAQLGLILFSCLLFFTGQAQALDSSTIKKTQEKQTQEQFIDEVRKNFEQEDFDALDQAAFDARESKERFPGAEWKLHVFYQTLTWPAAGARATDQAWTAHLNRLEKWRKNVPDSITARIALGGAWAEYAKKAYTTSERWTDIEGKIGGKEYQRRMTQAKKALEFDPVKLAGAFVRRIKRDYSTKTSSELNSYCPQWYVVRLAIEQAQPWEWGRYDNIFGQGIALEPTYYYLYQTKAADLLPGLDHHTTKRQWEAFADNSARAIGGKEGEITYYMIVSYMRRFFDSSLSQGNFFSENVLSGTRLLEGYKQIEATYGASNTRLNEMALMASMTKNYAMAKVFFDRIGDNWAPDVWQHKAEFDGYKALVMAKAPSGRGVISGPYGSGASTPQADLSALKATVSSRLASYPKSQDVVIEAAVEYTGTQGAYELGLQALSLAIQDTKKRGKEIILLPQSDASQSASKEIEPGKFVRVTYRADSALPPGEYKIRMKSVASNELLIRIGAPARR